MIAEAALRPYSASGYDEFYSKVAEYTGFAADDVEEIIDDLTTDKTLVAKIEPILNPTPKPAGTIEIVQQWYEKGPM